MEKDQEQKHVCKFCNKSFPCGRTLGGHMRSHLINISSSYDHRKSDEKLHKKKLPPPSTDQSTHALRHNPKKTSKFTKPRVDEDTIQEKSCKECGKAFQSWKALFGHMKCHSVNGNAKVITDCMDEDSWNSCSDHQKSIMDSQSDNEAATPSSCRRKRSDRMMKRYTATTTSSSLTITNSVSEMDQHEQKEVALSLIILSRDKGEWGGLDSFVDSSGNSPEISETNKIKKTDYSLKKLKKLRSMKQLEVNALHDEAEVEFEVNSPKNLIKRSDHDELEGKKSSSRKRKARDSIFHEGTKFTCSICKKAFQSYQALGGHRASHKKFNGSCAPRSEEISLETENSHDQSENLTRTCAEKTESGCKKSTDHECPICFKVFLSGQALGGHKRSHLIMDQAKNNTAPPREIEKPDREIRGFLDLNLPAPAEEECNEFQPWWIGAGRDQQRPLLGLLSS